ncbi:MAG: PilZ domain-containing protein [Casimicrobiaceae bacterium]
MSRERRKTFRVEWNSVATLYDRSGRQARPCIVANFSNGGAKIVGVDVQTIEDQVWLKLTPHGRMRKCHVLWRNTRALGVEFTDQRIAGPTASPVWQKSPLRSRAE